MGERLEEIDEEMVDEPLAIGEVIEVEVGGGDGTWLPAEVIDISSSADGRFVVMVDGNEGFVEEVRDSHAHAHGTEGHALLEPTRERGGHPRPCKRSPSFSLPAGHLLTPIPRCCLCVAAVWSRR